MSNVIGPKELCCCCVADNIELITKNLVSFKLGEKNEKSNGPLDNTR